MKYCYRFSNKIKNIDEADEIKIIYGLDQSKELLNFIKKHKETKITLNVRDPKAFFDNKEDKVIKAIVEQNPDADLAICFGYFQPAKELDKEMIENLARIAPVKYYFDNTITNWDMLHHYLAHGVTDVCIAEQLGFELPSVKKVCATYGATVRAFPNVAQASVNSSDSLKKFFIRPEDTDYYGQYIDILEFWGPEDRQATYRKIYEQREWFGDLKEIIFGLDISFDSRRILPKWAETRAECGKKCLKGHHCSICEKYLNVSKALEKQGYILKQKK